MISVRDMTPLEEYQARYDPVVTDRLIGQRAVRQHGVDTRKLGLTLDKLTRQQSLNDKQAEKERRIVQKELEAMQQSATGLTPNMAVSRHESLKHTVGLKWPPPAQKYNPETDYGMTKYKLKGSGRVRSQSFE